MSRQIATVALVIVVALSGCSLLPGGPQSDPGAADVRDNVSAAVESLDSYRYEVDLSISASAGGSTERVDGETSGVVNRAEKRLSATSTVAGTTSEQVVADGVAYTECQSPWDGWGVQNVSADTPVGPMDRQLELLAASPVQWGGNVTEDGRRLQKLVASPTGEELASLQSTSGSAPDYAAENIDNVTMRLWVDAESQRPVRSEVTISLSADGADAEANLETRFSEYGVSTDIADPEFSDEEKYELGCPGV